MNTPKEIEVGKLLLDARNPRLTGLNLATGASQDQIREFLWRKLAVNELVDSILASGFWQLEPLVVMPDDSKFVVLEGNRRLAAVQILRDDDLRHQFVGEVPEAALHQAIQQTERILCTEVPGRFAAWNLIGFKHVNGPARWSSFAKADYICQLLDAGTSMDEIADALGDRNRTVKRLARAYRVLAQAEHRGVWKQEYMMKQRLPFSYLMTGLDYQEIAGFLGITEISADTANPVPEDKTPELGELCSWLFGDSRDKSQAVVQAQNPDLKDLVAAVSSKDGVRELRRSRRLDIALEASKGDRVVLEEALANAKVHLERAQAKATSGFNGESAILHQAETAYEICEDLLSQLRRKQRRLREEGGTEAARA